MNVFRSLYIGTSLLLYVVMASLVSVCVSLTERLLLLLGWDKIESKHTQVYHSNKVHKDLVGTVRQRRRRADGAAKPNGEMFTNPPQMTPVRIVSQIARPPATSNVWTAGAFDTAVTGTV